MLALYYNCPKRKCRHKWSRSDRVAPNDKCPNCGAENICPVDIENLELEERSAK